MEVGRRAFLQLAAGAALGGLLPAPTQDLVHAGVDLASGPDNASIWLVAWNDEGCVGLVPRRSWRYVAGWNMQELEQELTRYVRVFYNRGGFDGLEGSHDSKAWHTLVMWPKVDRGGPARRL